MPALALPWSQALMYVRPSMRSRIWAPGQWKASLKAHPPFRLVLPPHAHCLDSDRHEQRSSRVSPGPQATARSPVEMLVTALCTVSVTCAAVDSYALTHVGVHGRANNRRPAARGSRGSSAVRSMIDRWMDHSAANWRVLTRPIALDLCRCCSLGHKIPLPSLQQATSCMDAWLAGI